MQLEPIDIYASSVNRCESDCRSRSLTADPGDPS